MSEPSTAPDAAGTEDQESKAPAPDPYGDVALGVECAWPMSLAS